MTPSDLNIAELPTHVAIIMDGNGRWAKKRSWRRIQGHEQGAETVRVIVRASREVGVRVLTLYAFSTENWERPQKEVGALMHLLKTRGRPGNESIVGWYLDNRKIVYVLLVDLDVDKAPKTEVGLLTEQPE